MALVSVHVEHKDGKVTVSDEWETTIGSNPEAEVMVHLNEVVKKVLKTYS